jgi:hypothetical protein
VLGQGGVRRGADLRLQAGGVGWADLGRAPRPRPGRQVAALAPLALPALDRRGPDAEEAGRLGLGQAGVDGPQQPLAEVGGVLLHPGSVAPGPTYPQAALNSDARRIIAPGAPFRPIAAEGIQLDRDRGIKLRRGKKGVRSATIA